MLTKKTLTTSSETIVIDEIGGFDGNGHPLNRIFVFACFGSRPHLSVRFGDDSASFCLGKLKNMLNYGKHHFTSNPCPREDRIRLDGGSSTILHSILYSDRTDVCIAWAIKFSLPVIEKLFRGHIGHHVIYC